MVGPEEKHDNLYSTTMNKSVWAMPILLAVLTLFGLLAALLGLGIWHWLSWITLCVPLGVVAWKWGRARR
jgi:hypothetical protein